MSKNMPQNEAPVKPYDPSEHEFMQGIIPGDPMSLEESIDKYVAIHFTTEIDDEMAVKAWVAASGFSLRTVRAALKRFRRGVIQRDKAKGGSMFFQNDADAVKFMAKVCGLFKGKKERKFICEQLGGGYSVLSEAAAKIEYAPFKVEKFNKRTGEYDIIPALQVYIESREVRWHPGLSVDPTLKFPPKDGELYPTWRGLAVRSMLGGRCDRIIHLIEHVICGGDKLQFSFIIEYLAQMIQNPAVKPGCMLVLTGGKGVGKSTLADLMCNIIGELHSMKISNARHLVGNFNEHLSQCLLLVVEELGWAGKDDVEDILKDIVTSNRLTVEIKGGAVEDRFNMTRVMLLTNRGWAVPAGGHERRYLVIDVNDPWAHCKTKEEREKESREYFAALYAEINWNGPRAFLDYLERHKLGSVDLRRPPLTVGLKRQAIHTLDAPARWLAQAVETGGFAVADGVREVSDTFAKGVEGWAQDAGLWPNHLPYAVAEADLKRSYLSNVRHHGAVTTAALVEALHGYGAKDARLRIGSGKERVRAILFPSRKEMAAKFAERGVDLLWDDDGDGESKSSAEPQALATPKRVKGVPIANPRFGSPPVAKAA